jgi:hypothetical protein
MNNTGMKFKLRVKITDPVKARTKSIHMPMIYGEREKAFLGLQQQIVQKFRDESLFVWSIEIRDDTARTYSGL